MISNFAGYGYLLGNINSINSSFAVKNSALLDKISIYDYDKTSIMNDFILVMELILSGKFINRSCEL
jgi:hypothetical protein